MSDDETETCPHCLSEDVTAGAQRCPHCGQRMIPRFTRATMFLLVALLVAVFAVVMVVRTQNDAQRHANDQVDCIVSSADPSAC